MNRNFGLTSRLASGAQPQAGSHYARDTQRDYFIPSGSILAPPAHPLLERSKVTQALIDGLAVAFGILFICATAASVPVALFILIFVGGH